MTQYTIDELTEQIKSIFFISDITVGTPESKFIVRYRGKLSKDSLEAYRWLNDKVKPLKLTPLFREEEGRQMIILVSSRPDPKPSNPWINLLLFILTLLSVFFTGIMYVTGNVFPNNLSDFWEAFLVGGLPFGLSMVAIFGTHEFGHYIAGRLHGVKVTLPYFIPLPFSPLGTMGAFINMKEQPRNQRDLLDIGIAGPLSGLVVSLVVLFIGLKISHLGQIETQLPAGMMLEVEGNSVLYLFMKFLAFGRMLPAPATYTIPPLLHWVRYFFTGTPLPFGATDVMLSPVAWAGWAGLLITSINLIPAGQLDGGHIFYVMFGKEKTRKLIPVILIILVLLGFLYSGWWLWAVIILLLGRTYAEPLDQITKLDKRRRALAILGIVVLFLTFSPIPLSIIQ